jgi:hypothetical protein
MMQKRLFSSIGRFARVAAPVVLVAGGLALAQPAAATDWCVDTACGGTPIATFDGALIGAAQWPDSDRIFLGAKTYTAPNAAGYNGAGPLEIIGAGQGQTILTAPSPSGHVLRLTGPAKVRDLSIKLGQMIASSAGVSLEAGATATRIDVTEGPQANMHWGVFMTGGAKLENSSVAIDSGLGTTGVYFAPGGGTVRDSYVSADWAVTSNYGGTIERSWLNGWTSAVRIGGGDNVIRNSVVKVNKGGGEGIGVVPLNGVSSTLQADGLTMMAGLALAGGAITAEAFNVPGELTKVDVRNSVIRGYTANLLAAASGAGKVDVTASWSDYDSSPGRVVTTGANAAIAQSNISNAANPGFVNGFFGNFHLLDSSPLIDAGDPSAPQGLDNDGNPSVTDGNHDGVARRDIGAFEVAGPLPVDPPQAAPVDDTPAPGGDSAPAGATGQPSTPTTPADTKAPVISSVRFTSKTFAVSRARTAIAARTRGTKLRFKLTEAAKVTVTIQKHGSRRAAGKLTRKSVAGSNTVKFSGRIGKRALRPGRYRVVMTATDAAGNRSAAVRASFRIV